MNPKEDPVYKTGGIRYTHQLIIQVATIPKTDPNIDWIQAFLTRFFFMVEATLPSVARSSINQSNAKFLDVVVFMKMASLEDEFAPFA
jgi:hypothetical protein